MPGRKAQTVAALKAKFHDRVSALGGTVIGNYADSLTTVECVCRNGHPCHPRPASVQQGKGICRICAGVDPCQAELNFRTKIAELGGSVTGTYVNALTPVECICRTGHLCRAIPNNIQQGQGICGKCARNVLAQAEAEFHSRVARLGGKVIGSYKGKDIRVECVCHNGHLCRPRPSHTQQGVGICLTCSGHDSAEAESAFRSKVGKLSGVVIGTYKGNKTQVECICREGHRCNPYPSNVMSRGGLCQTCAGDKFTVYYIVHNEVQNRFKHGKSSNDGKGRLAQHRRYGYTVVKLLLTGLPGDAASDIEDATQAALRLAGIKPIQGREYYEQGMDIALDIALNYPTS